MATQGPPSSTTSNLLSTHRALLDTLESFLTVTTHHILYLRRLYPPVSFLSTRAYNYPVRQNRHPMVCTWIQDAVSAIRDQFEKNTVEKVTLCIFECDDNRVLERWTFDLRSFPSVAKQDRDVPFDSESADDDDDLTRKVNLTDLEAHFRATLSQITTSAARLRPLPEGPDAPECSFALTIEVKEEADRPVGRIEREERKWIAAQPDSFLSGTPRDSSLSAIGKGGKAGSNLPKTHSVRRLEAGELRMEVWVEESATKFEFDVPTSQPGVSLPPHERAARMSYGAGRERFDPGDMYPYDLEPPDVNRRPQGGASTDYQRG
jgi:mitotic spindle assembly checkpoint protein MAD2B